MNTPQHTQSATGEKPKRGRLGGRQADTPGQPTVVATVRLTPLRRDKLKRLGASWLAKQVDAADESSLKNES